MIPDLRRYFGIDLLETIAGRGMRPSLVLTHFEALPDDSLTRALQRGGREFYGWDQNLYIQADIYDAVMQNTRLTGQWRTPPKIEPWPRPTIAVPPKVTLQSLYAQFITRR